MFETPDIFIAQDRHDTFATKFGVLVEDDLEIARAGWSYVENNTDPFTGLVGSVDGFPSTTLWDQGSYVMALVSAERLGIISHSEFQERATQLLASMERLPLLSVGLPNKVYNTKTLTMVDYSNSTVASGVGWSALDIGRFLLALRVLEHRYDGFSAAIDRILDRWDLGRVAAYGELQGGRSDEAGGFEAVQEGRIGYEQYAARALALWGLDVGRAMSALDNARLEPVSGQDIAIDTRRAREFGAITPVLGEPYFLMGLELGFDSEGAELARRLLAAQDARFRKTGQITMVSEDHLDRAPYFAYSSVYSNGSPWAVVDEEGHRHDEKRTVSAKALLAWHVLAPSDHTRMAYEDFASWDLDRTLGIPAGRYEVSGALNEVYSLNTNAIILEAMHFKVFGPLLSL